MFGWFALRSQRSKLRASLAMDPLQGDAWGGWLDASASVLHLRTSCPSPGWLVHAAYHAELPQDRMVDATLQIAQLAIERGPAGVFPGESIHDARTWPLPRLAAAVRDLETRYPGIRAIEQALPSQLNPALMQLQAGREPAADGFDLARDGAAGAAAGGFVLAIVTLFHHFQRLKESLTFTSAGAATMFALAMPDERAAILATLRDAYGWPRSMTDMELVK